MAGKRKKKNNEITISEHLSQSINLFFYRFNSLEINGHKQGPNSGYKPGSVALYHCHEGFVLLPFSAGKRVCRRGKWEGTIPACGKSII